MSADSRLGEGFAIRLARAFFASFAALAASLAIFLVHDGYPLLSADAGLAVLALVALSLLFGVAHAGSRRWVGQLLAALLVAFVVDLNSSSDLIPVLAGCVAFGLGFLLQERLLSLVGVFASIVLVTTIAGLGSTRLWYRDEAARPAAAARPTDLPALVHIIFDEHLGADGFPGTAAGKAAREDLLDTYERNGFVVFGGAYSEHMHTTNAIPAILNFGTRLADTATKNGVSVGRTEYFDRLKGMGFRLTIHQSDFAEFCGAADPDRCVTYESTSLIPLRGAGLSVSDRATVMLMSFLKLSTAVTVLDGNYARLVVAARRRGVQLPLPPLGLGRTASVASLAALDKFRQTLRAARPGEAYFVHAILPHYPYAADSSCRVKPLGQWRQRRQAVPIRDRQRAYYDQVKCSARIVDQLVGELNRSPAAGNFVFVVHGDHGSRITRLDPEATARSFRRSDLIASYSTLFAVRTPTSEGAYVPGQMLASDLLDAFSASGFEDIPRLPTQSAPTVFLDDENWVPRRRTRLPPF